MININIICVGKLKESYLKEALGEYQKRLKPYCKLSVVEVPEYKIPDNPSQKDIDKCILMEGKNILSKIPSGAYIISMCIEGKMMSSCELARKIENIAVSENSNIAFIIGGSYGLSDEFKNSSGLRLSVSRMTFPHQLARVMLCEQIYRVFQILNGGKYHK